MKLRLASIILLAATVTGMGCQSPSSPAPNVILFLVDDMGWQDTSVAFHTERTHFNDRYRTPNMERLASQGVRFTNAYATSVCSPTRISLMTGLNAARHRVTDWTLRKDGLQEREHPQLLLPEWNWHGLSNSSLTDRAVAVPTLPALLQKNGYRTIHVGKAHFGAMGTPGADPKNLGFDVNVAGHAAGAPGSYQGLDDFARPGSNEPSVWDVPGLETYHGRDINLSDALTLEARRHIQEAVSDDVPFYLYMAHYAIHTPIQPDHRYIQDYLAAGLDTTEARYASMIQGMDESLGDLLDTIEELGVADHTAILFMSDNGGLSAHGRGGERHSHNYPLSSGKGSAREGGVRVPMIVSWPGEIEGNTRQDTPVIVEDFFPSVLEIAEVDHDGAIDGRSFLDLAKGRASSDPDRALYWHYPNWWGPSGPGIGSTSAIRKGDWKLIYYHVDESRELFNLKDDLGEATDLSDTYNWIADSLAGDLRAHLIEVNAQMPASRTSGQVVALP